MVLPSGESYEGDYAAAAIRSEHLPQFLGVESLGLDEYSYVSHAEPSRCCA